MTARELAEKILLPYLNIGHTNREQFVTIAEIAIREYELHITKAFLDKLLNAFKEKELEENGHATNL